MLALRRSWITSSPDEMFLSQPAEWRRLITFFCEVRGNPQAVHWVPLLQKYQGRSQFVPPSLQDHFIFTLGDSIYVAMSIEIEVVSILEEVDP